MVFDIPRDKLIKWILIDEINISNNQRLILTYIIDKKRKNSVYNETSNCECKLYMIYNLQAVFLLDTHLNLSLTAIQD